MYEPYKIGMLDHIVEGLKKAVDEAYISHDEARLQFRAMLPEIVKNDEKLREAERLRDMADNLEKEMQRG